MASLQKLFEETVADKNGLPTVTATAVDKNGKTIFHKTAGRQSSKDDTPIHPEAIYWLGSISKLITTVAVLQAIERGLFGLDDDITKILPELKDSAVITLSEPFNPMDPADQAKLAPGGKLPSLTEKKREGIVTVRHLLTHTSGMAYDIFDPAAIVWLASRGEKSKIPACDLAQLIPQPLSFEPGTSWSYGHGFEWAGEMVARANNTSLETYLKDNILAPLGLSSTTFRIWEHPELEARETEMYLRTPEGPAIGVSNLPEIPQLGGYPTPRPAPSDMGGLGLFGSVSDFIAILGDLVSEKPRLLSAKSADSIFASQLSPGSSSLKALGANAPIWGLMAGIAGDEAPKVGFGLGGVLTLEDTTSLPKGTLAWGALPNMTWFANRERGVAGIFATHVVPFGDKPAGELAAKFKDVAFGKA
ncbi:Acyltransferase LovD [Lachnellula suecica]|uniref:Acyltransferase LovD n=1 Tax=Lachnellula suecica TaxID=602035 RepID=A0A8T9CA23_9HELO|nr:Acyltransferase LovD [Lachnellula suecica]